MKTFFGINDLIYVNWLRMLGTQKTVAIYTSPLEVYIILKWVFRSWYVACTQWCVCTGILPLCAMILIEKFHWFEKQNSESWYKRECRAWFDLFHSRSVWRIRYKDQQLTIVPCVYSLFYIFLQNCAILTSRLKIKVSLNKTISSEYMRIDRVVSWELRDPRDPRRLILFSICVKLIT